MDLMIIREGGAANLDGIASAMFYTGRDHRMSKNNTLNRII